MKSFYIMERNKIICKVEINGLKVNLIKYSNKKTDKQFPTDTPTIHDVMDWIEERCFSPNRGDAKEILQEMGLTAYDPLDIVYFTHGLLWDDYTWIKWEGEEICYDDIKIRDR